MYLGEFFGLWSIRIGVLIDHFHVPGLCERYYGIILSASRIVCMCYGGFVAGLDIFRYVCMYNLKVHHIAR